MSNIIKSSFKYLICPFLVSLFIFYALQTPKYSGIQLISNNNKYNPITIKRDQFGVPSIESKTLKDTLYGLGYAQAQDRLWAINSRRLLVSGRLSEIAGERTLEIDKFFRNVGIERYCKYSLEYAEPETLEYFQAFADGINDYVASSKTLPLEFWVTWSTFEPFTVLESFTNAKFIAFFLAFDFQFEFIFETLEDLLGPIKTSDILPYRSDEFLWKDIVVMNDDELKQAGIFEPFDEKKVLKAIPGTELPEERKPPRSSNPKNTKKNTANTKPTSNKKAEQKTEKASQNEPNEGVHLVMPEAQIGSNAWVVHGNHTTTGQPILANDPHLMNAIPAVWYPSSMFYDDGYISGVGLVGFPGVHIGRTKYTTWGITTLCSDTSDLYTLQIKDDKYFYEGEWHTMQEFKETIHVKGRKEPVEIIIYETHHGVVLDHYFPDIFITRDFRPRKGVRYALAWSGYGKKDGAYSAFFQMANAKNSQQLMDSWKDALEPAFSFLFATSSGDIGFLGAGKIPIRTHARDGLKPKDGSLKSNDWLGFVPWKDQPKIVNPKKGYIVSANNKMASDNIKYFTSANMFTTSRATRIDEMIQEFVNKGKKISVQDMITMQADTLDVLAREVVPIMIARTKDAFKEGYKLQVNNEVLTSLLNNLTNWDYKMEKESIPSTIFNVWERFLIRKLIKDIGLKEQDIKNMIVNAKFDHFFFRNLLKWNNKIPTEHHIWCINNENRNLSNPCGYNLIKSLEEAYLHLQNNYGTDIEDWQWGKIHRMQYPHSTFSSTPLKPIFHRSIPSIGNGRTVNVARMKMETDDFGGVWSPNLKMVVSMKEGDKSYYVVDTGVSENVFSEHYDDQMKLVAEGKYMELPAAPQHNPENVLYLKFKPN